MKTTARFPSRFARFRDICVLARSRTATLLVTSIFFSWQLAACARHEGSSSSTDGSSLDGDVGNPWADFPSPGRHDLRGFMVFGNELHGFQLCGSAATAWVNLQGGEPGISKLDGLVGPICEFPDGGAPICSLKSVYVELDANVSGPGHYGHLSRYERALDINELKSASQTAPANCIHVTPRLPQTVSGGGV